MPTQTRNDQLAAQRLMLMIFYRGPWERLANYLWRTPEDPGDIAEEFFDYDELVHEDSIRGRLALWAERRDVKWRNKYVMRGTKPHKRWDRK